MIVCCLDEPVQNFMNRSAARLSQDSLDCLCFPQFAIWVLGFCNSIGEADNQITRREVHLMLLIPDTSQQTCWKVSSIWALNRSSAPHNKRRNVAGIHVAQFATRCVQYSAQ